MDTCPNCNSPISDDVNFCNNCGHEIVGKKRIGQYMKLAINRIIKNPTIIILGIILSLLKFLPTILILVYGRDKISEYLEVLESGTGVLSYSAIFYTLMIGVLFTTLINILLSPFLTCLYLQVIKGEPISYKLAYNYFRSRFVEFIKAQLIVMGLGIISLTPLGIIYIIYKIFESSIFMMMIIGIVFLLYIFALLYIVSALTFTLPVMVIEEFGSRDALSLSITFYREYFWQLFGFGIIINFIRSIVEDLPFSDYYIDVLEVISSLVIIDIFINYRKLKSIELRT